MKVKAVKVQKADRPHRVGHMYFFIQNESIIENLQNRRQRPHKEYRKLIPDALRGTRFETTEFKAHWSQKCGCSCGCSPGFRLKGIEGYDIFVDIE